MEIRIVRPGTEDWQKSTALVRQRYSRNFDADIEPSPDCFIGCFEDDDDGGQRVAACSGMSFGDRRPRFFSEQYLPDPIESMIARAENTPVSRSSIVEVGALASAGKRAGTELVQLLPVLIWCMGKRYVLCTATRPLRLLLEKNDIVLRPLGAASRESLPEQDSARWGNYYEQMPQVGYFSIAELTATFMRNTGRYRFSNPAVTLQAAAHEDEAEYAVA